VRRDYESLYSLGVAFTAYAAAEAVHGSGFLAAFAAGMTIAALDVELCDCFVEYGQTTAEMALLFTFVLFGTSLIWKGFTVLSWPVLWFAIIVLLVRPIAFLASLTGTSLDHQSRLLIAWFGPRGLSSLLLILVPVFAGTPGTELLFFVCCFVVVLSVVLHGGSLMLLGSGRTAYPAATLVAASAGREEARPADPPPTLAPARKEDSPGELITIGELRELQQAGAPVVLLDARAERSFANSSLLAQGALRVDPDRAVERLKELDVPLGTWIVVFCA
jgi:NhaP-type Na+/H+ or K+/H+ antiporter